MLTPGQKIFEYEIIKVLGRGGFAAVYQAHDRMLDRQVAIKQLLLDRAKEAKSVKRFMQEARIGAALEHPNVVTIYALRVKEQRIYMVMEYLPGGSLKELIEQESKLPIDQAVKITTGICEGLAKLHSKGIIHRDIKAENILLTDDQRPKITDFGIAHVPQGAGGMGLTLAGFQPSTVVYSSPEQFRGEKLDTRSDVYQVGELLYYMLTGNHYINFTDLKTQAETIRQNIRHDLKVYMLLEKAICVDMPSGLYNLPKELSGVAGVIEKAMANRKEDRFEDTLSFAAELWAAHFNSPTATFNF